MGCLTLEFHSEEFSTSGTSSGQLELCHCYSPSERGTLALRSQSLHPLKQIARSHVCKNFQDFVFPEANQQILSFCTHRDIQVSSKSLNKSAPKFPPLHPFKHGLACNMLTGGKAESQRHKIT